MAAFALGSQQRPERAATSTYFFSTRHYHLKERLKVSCDSQLLPWSPGEVKVFFFFIGNNKKVLKIFFTGLKLKVEEVNICRQNGGKFLFVCSNVIYSEWLKSVLLQTISRPISHYSRYYYYSSSGKTFVLLLFQIRVLTMAATHRYQDDGWALRRRHSGGVDPGAAVHQVTWQHRNYFKFLLLTMQCHGKYLLGRWETLNFCTLSMEKCVHCGVKLVI